MFGILAEGQHAGMGLLRCRGGFRRGRCTFQRRAREARNVGTMLAPQRLACHQRADHAVQPEKEWLAQRKARRDVDPGDREQVRELDLAGVLLGILVEPGRIGFE